MISNFRLSTPNTLPDTGCPKLQFFGSSISLTVIKSIDKIWTKIRPTTEFNRIQPDSCWIPGPSLPWWWPSNCSYHTDTGSPRADSLCGDGVHPLWFLCKHFDTNPVFLQGRILHRFFSPESRIRIHVNSIRLRNHDCMYIRNAFNMNF